MEGAYFIGMGAFGLEVLIVLATLAWAAARAVRQRRQWLPALWMLSAVTIGCAAMVQLVFLRDALDAASDRSLLALVLLSGGLLVPLVAAVAMHGRAARRLHER